MEKEKFKEQKDEYQEKLRLIQKLADELNKEFDLEGEDRITSTPDLLVVPVTHEDGERVEHAMNLFKTEKQNDLKIPVQMKKDSAPLWILASDFIKSLIKFGSEFSSRESQLSQKCLEKLKEGRRKQRKIKE